MQVNSILITGASRGIGLELVKQFYRAGWQVLASCRSPDSAIELQNLAAAAEQKILIYKLDVTDEKNIIALSKQLISHPIDILVNNAGIFGPENTTLDSIQVADWQKVFKINTIAPLLVARAFLKQICNGEKKLIANISSVMGSITLNTDGSEYIYRSSKAALNSVTKSLANQLKSKKITVVALHPGWVKTDMGGPNAVIELQTCGRGLLKVINSLTLKNTGQFLNYKGEQIAW